MYTSDVSLHKWDHYTFCSEDWIVQLRRYEVTYKPNISVPLLILWLLCGRVMMIARVVHSGSLTQDVLGV